MIGLIRSNIFILSGILSIIGAIILFLVSNNETDKRLDYSIKNSIISFILIVLSSFIFVSGGNEIIKQGPPPF